MKDFKGTPGPWKIVSGKIGDDGSEIEAENSEFWAFVSFDTPESERIPNANLISAAPELFKAVNAFLNHFEGNIPLWLFEEAEAAVSKALGE